MFSQSKAITSPNVALGNPSRDVMRRPMRRSSVVTFFALKSNHPCYSHLTMKRKIVDTL